MANLLHTSAPALILIASLGPLSGRLGAAPQATDTLPPQSVERIRNTLNSTPTESLKFDVKLEKPVATFRRSVNQRAFTITILEQLRKDFELTPLQRQSAEWSSRCCGLNLLTLTKSLEKAWRLRQERKAREQVRREFAEFLASTEK